MASLLVLGAIPSGLAGTISSAGGLYTIRFFIGILGATFVPCQAWTTAFFDKNIVGTANAFAGGWGNLGYVSQLILIRGRADPLDSGGVTFVVQVSLYEGLVRGGLSSHSAWRAAFAIVPVPILLLTAAATLIYGTDCPAGPWSARHTLPASALAAKMGHLSMLDGDERRVVEAKMAEKEQGHTRVQEAQDEEDELSKLPEPIPWTRGRH